MYILASIDDVFIKLVSDPDALGALAFILIVIVFITWSVMRFASGNTKSITEVVKEDNKDSNTLLGKLVDMASEFSHSAKQLIVVVQNNTNAFTEFKATNDNLSANIVSFGNQLTTVQSDLITKLDDLACRVSKVETQGNDIYNLVLTIRDELLALNLKGNNTDGKSDNTNPDSTGHSG